LERNANTINRRSVDKIKQWLLHKGHCFFFFEPGSITAILLSLRRTLLLWEVLQQVRKTCNIITALFLQERRIKQNCKNSQQLCSGC